jgi:hypothetical protein
MVHLLAWPAGLYALLCLLAFAFQRRLTYFPQRAREADLLAQAGRIGLEPWRDAGGRLIGWQARHPGGAQARAVVFHGNAGLALARVYYPRALRALRAPGTGLRWDVHILEYPGYGAREGSPSEAALVEAALAALDGLPREPALPTVLVGESLGAVVASRCAQARPRAVRGLLLVTPLTSGAELAKEHYPILPRFVLRDRLDTRRALARLDVPLAMLVAGRDEVVPAPLQRGLFEAYGGPKRLWTDPGAGHNDWDASPANPLWHEVSAFLVPEAHRPPAL